MLAITFWVDCVAVNWNQMSLPVVQVPASGEGVASVKSTSVDWVHITPSLTVIIVALAHSSFAVCPDTMNGKAK